MRTPASSLAIALLLAGVSLAAAQDKGTLNPQPLPPLAHPDDPKTPAKQLFGRKTEPTAGPSHVVGFYSSGCLAGAEALPINGPTWQVMRLSRNRNWGHPQLIHFLENLSAKAAKTGTWPGLLVGDMSQPRGGPMITGHASHQVGLDADIWLSPMPPRQLSRVEREEMSATMGVAADRKDVDPKLWTHGHFIGSGKPNSCHYWTSVWQDRAREHSPVERSTFEAIISAAPWSVTPDFASTGC